MHLNFLWALLIFFSASVQSEKHNSTIINVIKKKSSTTIKKSLVCPSKQSQISFFTLPCRTTKDCTILGPEFVCCNSIYSYRCLKGLPAPKPELPHKPLLGIINRKCPKQPLIEIRQIKSCTTDEDCVPRLCCPERPGQGGGDTSYCRTAILQLHDIPAAKSLVEPVRNVTSFFQCSPMPQNYFNLLSKPCNSIWDCFPSLCCQEQGKRVCRPPKQSVLPLLIRIIKKISQLSASVYLQSNL